MPHAIVAVELGRGKGLACVLDRARAALGVGACRSALPARWTPSTASTSTAIPTFALLLEAQRRGHKLFYYTPPNLSSAGRAPDRAAAPRLQVEDKVGSHYRLSRAAHRGP